jgi:hypothetical protein
MAKKITGKKVRAMIQADNMRRLLQEEQRFLLWWSTYDDRIDRCRHAAWEAWKARAGL